MNKVPKETWLGRKPIANHLNVFGSLCYKHIHDAIRRKLEYKSKLMILVVYHNTSAYRLINPMIKQISISKDMVILEDETCNQKVGIQDVTSLSVPLHSKTCEGDENGTHDTTNNADYDEEPAPAQVRLKRARQLQRRLIDCEIVLDNEIGIDREMMQLVMFANAELVE